MVRHIHNEANESTVPFILMLHLWNIFKNHFTAAIGISTLCHSQLLSCGGFFQQDYIFTKRKVTKSCTFTFHHLFLFYHIRISIFDLPYCRWFRTFYFQIIIFFFHLEICKYEWDSITRFCHNCPCAICIIMIFIRKVGARDDSTWSSHSSSTSIFSCQKKTKNHLLKMCTFLLRIEIYYCFGEQLLKTF